MIEINSKVRLFTLIIMVIIMVFILINEYNLRETGQDILRIAMTASIMIVTLLVNIYGGDSPSKNIGLFQWGKQH